MVPHLWRLQGEKHGSVWDADRQQFIDKPNHRPVFFDPTIAVNDPQLDRCRA
ncbi:MAG: hypothetical protein R2932_21210 [Caldilineaceae bacterium]